MYLMYLLTASGLFYFSILRKRVDLYSLAFASACIYFLPAYFGFTSHHIRGLWIYQEIQLEQYLIMLFVLFTIILSSFLFDNLTRKEKQPLSNNAVNKPILLILFCALCVSLLLMLYSMGVDNVLSDSKRDVLEVRNRWYLLFSVIAPLYGLIAFSQKNPLHLLIGISSILFLTFIGFRTPLMIFVLAGCLIYLSGFRKPLYKIVNFKFLSISLLSVLLLFVYKKIYVQVKLGHWDVIKERLFTSELYIRAIGESESFITQDILNTTLRHTGEISFNFANEVIASFILFGDKVFSLNNGFSQFVNNVLYSHIDYGVASNIWAQMYALAGWAGIVIFSFVFNGVVALFIVGMRSRFVTLKALYANLGVLWVFSLHRNDLAYLLVQQKRVVLVFMVALFASLILKNIFYKPKFRISSV